jgi:hypothetical protein
VVLAWPERWTVAPLLVQVLPSIAPVVLAAPRQASPPRAAISFLQMFGLTEEHEPRWRRRLCDLEPIAGHG